METGSRISELRSSRGWSQPSLASKMDVSQSTVAMWESGKRNIGNEDLRKLASLFNVSTDYLLGLSSNKLSLANVKEPISFNVATQNIPAYGLIHAGSPTFADEHIIGETTVPDRLIKDYGKETLFALKVQGDSMSRVIAPNFIAVFAKDAQVENGDIVAVLIDGEDAAIKRFRKTSRAVLFEPDSFNPSYKPIIFSSDAIQDYHILGKYVYATSMLI